MMKKLFSLLLLFIAIGLNAKELSTLVVTTNPPLSCSNCENTIKGNLRFEKGIKKIETDIPNQRVTITYDADKTDPEKIEKAFSKIHYEVSEIPDNNNSESSALPECCVKNEACCNPPSSCCPKDKTPLLECCVKNEACCNPPSQCCPTSEK